MTESAEARPGASYEFGPFRLEPATRRLLRGAEEIDLRPKALDLLVLLVEHRDRALGKDELMARLWPDSTVEESNLTQCVFLLRKALGRQPSGEDFVATVSRYGYRFVASVTERLPHPTGRPTVAGSGSPDRNDPRRSDDGAAPIATPRPGRAHGRRPTAAWLAALLVVASLVAWALARRSRPDTTGPSRSRAMVSLHLVGAPPVDINVPGPVAISPDGRLVAVVARSIDELESSLWLRALDDETARPLDGTTGARAPFWSPDGDSLAFFADGKLKRVPISGGPPDTLCDAPEGLGGTWNRRGVILFGSRRLPIQQVRAAGGEPSPVTVLGANETYHAWPVFLPDGERFLYGVSGISPEVYVGELSGGPGRHLLSANRRTLVSAEYVLFTRGRGVRAQRFDPRTGGLIGEPATLPLWPQLDGIGSTIVSVADSGTIVYLKGSPDDSELRWFDRAGNDLGQVGRPAAYYHPRLSPDGRRVAVDVSTDDEFGGDVWILPATAGAAEQPATRLTHDRGNESNPMWSPDGSRVLFLFAAGRDPFDLFAMPSSGLGEREEIFRSPSHKWPSDWSPDAEHVLMMMREAEADARPRARLGFWTLSLADRQTQPFLPSPFGQWNARFSPDGKWVVHTADASGQAEVYVRDFPHGRQRLQVSSGGGDMPVWSRDGREIFYHALAGNRLMAVPFVAGTTPALGPAETLFTLERNLRLTGTLGAQYDVAPDGRFLMNMMRSEPGELTLILDGLP
jgi:DNA-binding winged helix-turn-helix (wHTH) protein/Tol biopolymer transport system component